MHASMRVPDPRLPAAREENQRLREAEEIRRLERENAAIRIRIGQGRHTPTSAFDLYIQGKQ